LAVVLVTLLGLCVHDNKTQNGSSKRNLKQTNAKHLCMGIFFLGKTVSVFEKYEILFLKGRPEYNQ
jgi:hypothetical protein